jgi:hypothetical protein
MIKWDRYAGYEVSSMGDSRFSAFNAILPDGRSIEEHYQCDVKGYDPGGHNWRKGKGKPPLDTSVNLYKEYLTLWEIWAKSNKNLLDELYDRIGPAGILSDNYATSDVNQARALADILNKQYNLIPSLD